MKNQCQKLLDYMKVHGKITGLQSINELGVMNYKGRIYDLRRLGFAIETKYVSRVNAEGELKTFAEYILKG